MPFERILVAIDGSAGSLHALSAARKEAERAGVDLEVDVRPGHAAELIVRYAREHAFDLVVVGHKGHFLEDYLLGSTADRVAHHAPCPVLIVK